MLFKNPQNRNRCTFGLGFTSSARTAWRLILQQQIQIRQRPLRLMLPAYIGRTDREGSGIFDPVQQLSASANFYPVDGKLIPHLPTIERAIVSGEVDLLLVIHYFGFVQADLLALQRLCWQHDVTLVEDCAHCCFSPGLSCGEYGDYSFFSLHKFFPTTTGGVLRCNPNARNAGELPEIAQPDQCELAVLEQVMRTNIVDVTQQRRENFEFLASSLAAVQGIQPMMELKPHTIPHNFPVVVTGKLREKLYFYLAERDLITTALYYRLVDEIAEADFPVSHDLANRILNLPVHQDTDLSDLKTLVAEIEKFFESESVSNREL